MRALCGEEKNCVQRSRRRAQDSPTLQQSVTRETRIIEEQGSKRKGFGKERRGCSNGETGAAAEPRGDLQKVSLVVCQGSMF